jgi:hypothetical protein
MTTPVNGYVPAQYLSPLVGSSPVVLAERNTADAWRRMKTEHPGASISPSPVSGYWSRALDQDIRNNPGRYNITDKNLSPLGQSKHGLGIRINVQGINATIAAQYGFSQFNAYTYTYTGVPSWDQSAPAAPAAPAAPVYNQPPAVVGRIAHYLNSMNLNVAKTTAASNDIPGPNYWRAVQKWGSLNGLYSQPQHPINGIPGPHTFAAEDALAARTEPPVSAPVIAPPPVIVAAPEPKPTPAPEPTPTPTTAPPVTTEPAKETPVSSTPIAPVTPITAAPAEPVYTQAELDAYAAQVQADANLNAGATGQLAGLLSTRPATRKSAYYTYSGLALLISFGPDIIVAGVLSGSSVPEFVAIVGLASSVLLKLGVAFGFVAASNTK